MPRCAGGRRAARATIGVVRLLDRHGLGTVESGQVLAAAPDGDLAGELLHGALDRARRAARDRRGDRRPADHPRRARRRRGRRSTPGLACGGGVTLLAHPLPAPLAAALGDALERGPGRRPGHHRERCRSTGPDRSGPRRRRTARWARREPRPPSAADTARSRLRRGATVTERIAADDADLLLDLWVPVPSVLVVGAGRDRRRPRRAGRAARLDGARRATDLDEARTAVAGFSDADVLVLLDHDPEFDAVLARRAARRPRVPRRARAPGTPRPPAGSGCTRRA